MLDAKEAKSKAEEGAPPSVCEGGEVGGWMPKERFTSEANPV
jgi:hypothetical protein